VEVYRKVVAVAITAFANIAAISARAISTCGTITRVITIIMLLLLLSHHHYLCATIFCSDYKRKSSMLNIFISFCL
jgi:hypothetical protein